MLKFDKAEVMGWLAEVIADGLAIQALPVPFLEDKPMKVSAELDMQGLIEISIEDFTFHVDIVEKDHVDRSS
jgi:hypothetical protein